MYQFPELMRSFSVLGIRETPVSKASGMEVNNHPSVTSQHFAAVELMLLERRRNADNRGANGFPLPSEGQAEGQRLHRRSQRCG